MDDEAQLHRDAEVAAAFNAYQKGRTYKDDHGRRRAEPFAHRRPLWDAMWSAADFSWTGLADAGWERRRPSSAQDLKRWEAPIDFPGGGAVRGKGADAYKPATLQDYWRWVPDADWTEGQGWAGGRLASDEELKSLGLLVEADGALWHVLHRTEMQAVAPTATARDEASDGAKALGAAIHQRLALAKADANANLTGARAAGLDALMRAFAGPGDAKRPLHLTARLAAFDRFEGRGLTFGCATSFALCAFGRTTSFNDTTFGDRAQFVHASFGEASDFSDTTFGDRARFIGATFDDDSWFRSATFGDEAAFHSAAFGADADFRDATFGDRADFCAATFDNGASFTLTTFGARALFVSARFGDRSVFNSARFGDGAGFNHAAFGDGASFRSAAFAQSASFDSATFGDEAVFHEATFGDAARFKSATFGGRADFDCTRFEGRLLASGLACAGQFSMRAAEVKGFADFSDTNWPDALERQHAAFEGSRFRAGANFETDGFAAYAMFHRVDLSGPVQIADPEPAFARAVAAAETTDTTSGPNARPRGADSGLRTLAGGLRTLKLAMAAQGDFDREQRFYRYEVQARARMPDQPWSTKTAVALYGLAADYGGSIGRPFLALAAMLAVFAAIYWTWAYALGLPAATPTLQSAAQALDLSVSATFGPLSAPGVRTSALGAQLIAHDAVTALGVRVVSTVQSLAAIVLAILVGVAMRRRFRSRD